MLKGNSAYLATRGDSETMCRQHPWIKDEIAKTRSRRGVVIGFIGADRGRGGFDYFASTHIRTMQNHVHLWVYRASGGKYQEPRYTPSS
ncbi:MAG: hypothetical protein J7J01_00700 [Methanophagales archaeon]|nr:hypothetical protein [Methanophagales archaeon]